MRTFGRDAWDEAQELWRTGEFSDEWRVTRHQAAMRGMLYPPEGTRFDSWDDDAPSQRAMLIRAIRETPSMLAIAISKSRTWGEVIAYLIRRRDDWRAEMDARARLVDFEKTTPRQAMMSIAAIFDRIDESRGPDRER